MAFKMSSKMEEVQRAHGSNHGYQINRELAIPDEEYKPPPFPVEFPKFTKKYAFGAEIKEKHFYLEKEWAYLNHGAFGASLIEAMEAKMAWLVRCERQSVRFFEREFFPHLTHVIRRLAKFVDADRHDVVFVPNATTGVDSVVQSVARTLRKGDSILVTSLAYGTIGKFVKRIGLENDIRVDEIEIKFPMKSQDSLVELVENCIKPDTKLAVIDHVTSAHGVLLPVKEIVKVCHKRGVQVCVDAAHCFGSFPLSMRDLGADYYVANAHKWFLSPKGCAFLYVDKARQDIVRPLVLSWGTDFGMSAEFGWIGTDDYSSYLCMNTVLDFWEFYGPDNIREYIYKMVRSIGELLVKEWDSELLDDPSFFAAMTAVRLPEGLIPADGPEVKMVKGNPVYDFSHAVFVGNILHQQYKIEVPLKAIQGRMYARMCVHIHNEMSDYQRLADAVNDIRKKNLVQ